MRFGQTVTCTLAALALVLVASVPHAHQGEQHGQAETCVLCHSLGAVPMVAPAPGSPEFVKSEAVPLAAQAFAGEIAFTCHGPRAPPV